MNILQTLLYPSLVIEKHAEYGFEKVGMYSVTLKAGTRTAKVFLRDTLTYRYAPMLSDGTKIVAKITFRGFEVLVCRPKHKPVNLDSDHD